MDANIVALISAISATVGVIGTALFQYFNGRQKNKADEGLGYGKAILDSHAAVWGEVSAMREEMKRSHEDLVTERKQNADLSIELRIALSKMDEVIDEKRQLVMQMGILNGRIQALENENHILQDKVDKLTSELERKRTQE